MATIDKDLTEARVNKKAYTRPMMLEELKARGYVEGKDFTKKTKVGTLRLKLVGDIKTRAQESHIE